MAGRAATDRVIRGRFAISVNDPGHPTPKGWQRVLLTDVAELGTGHTPSRSVSRYWDGGVAWIGIRDAGAHHGGVINDTVQHITEQGLQNSAARLLPAGTICLSRTASVGYVVKMGRAMATSQDFVNWTCSAALEPDFLMRALLAEGAAIRQFGEGSTHTTIYFPEVKAFHIDLPPIEEQRRIVAKLDTLTARLARARTDLDRVPVLAKELRTKVFQYAVDGRLAADFPAQTWSEEQRAEMSTRRKAYLSARRGSRLRSDIPEQVDFLDGARRGWLDCRLADVIDLRVGHAFKSADFVETGGTPLLRGANIAPGKVDWTDKVELRPGLESECSKYRLSAGDIVIAMDRPVISTGLKLARLAPEDTGSLLVQRVANPQVSRWVLPDFVMVILRSSLFLKQIEDHSTGTDLPHISANDILTTPCPLPPIEVQEAIAARVADALARADRMEAEATRARALLDRLEAAVLAKAFQGELVPQDPTDEPANTLLARIRAQRTDIPKAARGRKPKG